MLMVQERAGRPKTPRPSNAEVNRVDDDSIENELVSLLGQVDFLREKMIVARNEGSPSRLLCVAEELLKHVSTFAQEHVSIRSSLEMKAAESKANEFRLLALQLKNPDASEVLARQAFQTLSETVMAFFSAFTRQFSTSLAARSWVDVAATFVVDLQQIPQAFTQPK